LFVINSYVASERRQRAIKVVTTENSSSMSDLLASAKELFREAKYAECKAAVDSAIAASDAMEAAVVKDLKLLLRKCNTHLLPTAPAVEAPTEESVALESKPVAVAPAAVPATVAPPAAAAPATVRFEWFQTPASVTLTFYVKNRTEQDVTVHSTDRSVDVTIRLDADGREYQYHIEKLFSPVEAAVVSVRSMKVEVVMNKRTTFHWPTLEVKHDSDVVRTIEQPRVVAAATAPGTAKELAYPNSKGRNWSNFKVDEEEEKPEGDAALNALFKQIYGNGSDEQRKAMIKSFTESNGTVLSTNWSEVGTKKVSGEAPKGMEAKPYME
jgi:suppressor of G2 allele of SKP1